MADRIDVIRSHLPEAPPAVQQCDAAKAPAAGRCPFSSKDPAPLVDNHARLDLLESRLDTLWGDGAHLDPDMVAGLAGPLHQGMLREEQVAVVREVFRAQNHGMEHLLWVEYQKRYGGEQGMAANLLVPHVQRNLVSETGSKIDTPQFLNQVILCHPEDCLRIAEKHVQKQGNFTPMFKASVISTTDNTHWKSQRDVLTPAFLPQSSLAKVFPISRARGTASAERLTELVKELDGVVNMNEFFLYEAKAQLRLAMFGDSQEEMERINRPYRQAMDGMTVDGVPPHVAVSKAMQRAAENIQGPSQGPLSQALMQVSQQCPASALSKATTMGNLGIFSFAGHDTTGHTMTWLSYELSRHPDVQRRLIAEVDALWDKVEREGREFEYNDFFALPFMTRCIMETLRLWPAVAPGTFRVLGEDDWVTGKDGGKVWLKKGTPVQVTTWSRHRNPDLWGADVNEFNPDREFEGKELWDGKAFSAANPHSKRFSPFTFPPRDCIGKNFSQMEMRLIYLNMLRNFEIAPAPSDLPVHGEQMGVMYGTLAPRDTRAAPSQGVERSLVTPVGNAKARTPSGLFLRVVPRNRA
eukprot:TRINITY_DN7018_c0_g1_i5.p1 TRINITY_DN7018_c0_g1~~TRINITY_DN7018_c0_g1_i5.p1  ORF type:complete len:594 (+),score=207.62 TRINITY_DN7018_c0_g1_i5:41-1783(+)